MSAGEAAWVRDNAWTRQIHKDHGDDHYATCPCQYGPCGHCQAGRHHNCAHNTPGYSVVSPEAYVTDHRSQVLSWRVPGARSVVAAVWLPGRACRWRCPCEHHRAQREPAQLALFEMGEAA